MQTDWSQFFGRFHPLIVHLPIGIIAFALLLSITAICRKSILLDKATNIALLTGGGSAILAIITGLLLSDNGGYDAGTLFWHKWIGIIAAAVCFVSWLIRGRQHTGKKISDALLAVCTIMIAIGAHLGGNMTHGEGYLAKYLPAPLQKFLGYTPEITQKKTFVSIDSVMVYEDIIQPIFNNKCINCHNPGKQKGALDLSSREGVVKGGKSGAAVVAADLEKSELFHRVTLPVSSSKFMPADNQLALTPVEISLIKWWINAGADYQKNIAEFNADEKSKYLFSAYMGISTEDNKDIILPDVPAPDPKQIKQLEEEKVIIRLLSSKTNLLEASLVMVQNTDAAHIEKLLQKLSLIKDQLYRLDVKHCNLTKQSVATISGFSRLSKLDLRKTNLTDEAINPLSNLKELSILNIGENNITDQAFTTFKQLSGLKKINLWQTKVTEEGINNFKSESKNIIIEN